VRDLRCFDGGLMSERCDDELKEPERNKECQSKKNSFFC